MTAITYDRRRKPPGATARAASASGRVFWPAFPVVLLLISLVLPWTLTFGPIAVSPYRLVLLCLTPPCCVYWLSGKAGKIRLPDVLIALYCLWCTLALVMVHGPSAAVEPGGMLFIETLGAYLVARYFIRRPSDFVATSRLLFLIVALMMPLALLETVTRQKVMLNLFDLVLPTIEATYMGYRWGLARVQGPVEHPILFGVFCGGAVAFTYFVVAREAGLVRRWLMTGAMALTAMLSLSSGPITAVLGQLALVAWNGVLGRVTARWKILWVIVICAYVVLELGSNQSVAQILTRFAFDPWTAFYRLLIFEYGWASVMAHPFFGTGFNEWLRAAWMPPSIDMFWLLPAVRHGLPAGMLLMLAFFAACWSVSRKVEGTGAARDFATGYLITMTGFFLVGWTVHFWNATYVLFMFLLGSGMWLIDHPSDAGDGTEVRRRRPGVPVPRGALR